MTVAEPINQPVHTFGKAFSLEREGDLGILWFDLQGEKVNKFSSSVMIELDRALDEIASFRELRYLVLASRKSVFIAGADIQEFTQVTSPEQAEEFTRFGQRTFLKLSKLPQISVAAIGGACMGGGTEIALNCDYRVMSDSPKATIALPEVKLGIFPAWTGTTKLPRLVGLPAALDVILTGKTLDGRRAKRIGLVDEVIPATILLDEAKTFARKASGKRRGSERTHFYLEGNPIARKVIFGKARAGVMKQTRGHYPAPLKAIEVMELGYAKGLEAGLAAEAREASRLIVGDVARNLVRLFFLMEESKKDHGEAAPRPVTHAGVLGAGVMGGGIAQIIADKAGIDVRMKDINWQALAGGMKAASKIWKRKLDRRRISKSEMNRKLSLITTSTDWRGLEDCDLVIEAVVESIPVKQQVLAEFEAIGSKEAIFASNTSTIPITQIADKAQRPGNVVGMHFFNPVDRMPLVEVIRGARSSPLAVATVAAFARKLGKTVVVCNDGPGFVVNRILGPYISEAAHLLEEGNAIETIDDAMLDFGMPMGPLALLDEVGHDVAVKSGKILAESFPDRMQASDALPRLVADGRLGKKNGRGMYRWREGKREGADPSVYSLLGVTPRIDGPKSPMAERMVLAMINEASMILGDRVVASASELDLAMIMGTGFPPFRGGLLRHADSLGIRQLLIRLEELERSAGARFKPSSIIRTMAESGKGFYAG